MILLSGTAAACGQTSAERPPSGEPAATSGTTDATTGARAPEGDSTGSSGEPVGDSSTGDDLDGTGTTTGGDDVAEVCPAQGRATLRLAVDAPGRRPAPSDRLTVALFTVWPPTGAPARSEQLPGAALSFPEVLIDTEVEPGDYVVYVCFDPGGDSPTNGACGDDDLWMLHDGGRPLSVEAGTVVGLDFDLVAGTSRLEAVDTARALGCPRV